MAETQNISGADLRRERGLRARRASDMEEKSGTVNSELQPLAIPEGISEDELSKVFLNILLRRALCESNPLSKWVLLGASEVLQGRTPKLTATMLSQLVNVSQQSKEQTKQFEDKASQIQIWRKGEKN